MISKYMQLLICVSSALASLSCAPGESPLVQEASEAAKLASKFFRDSVAYRGGYLWKHAADFSYQWGEVEATPSQIWVQPPGTPSVGMAYLDLYEATGDTFYLGAAKDAGDALIWGQLACGGWWYKIDFDSLGSRRWYYRRDQDAGIPIEDGGGGTQKNHATFDDNTTQAALRLLMRVDKATGYKEPYHGAALYALEFMMEAQFENGAWPQQYLLHPRGYTRHYTFNDAAINNCIEVMREAYATYGDERYRQSMILGGRFIIASQIETPQRGWAQQYDHDMHPAWARAFEPPAVCSRVTMNNISSLMMLFRQTADTAFLAPIPSALEWLETSLLKNGKLARFYELDSNRPIYGDSDNSIHYAIEDISDERMLGYSWYQTPRTGRLRREYEALLAHGRTYDPEKEDRPIEEMDAGVREIVSSLDQHGRWIEEGEILTRTFLKNSAELAKYIVRNPKM